MKTAPPPRVVVLGVGNVLLGDEGVGVHAISALERSYVWPQNVRCVDGGTSTSELLGDLEDLDCLIVLDAVLAGRAPGSLVQLEGAAVPAAFTTRLSPHQVGISDLLATLTFTGHAPREVMLLGVEPVQMTLGLELTPQVASQVPELCRLVVEALAHRGIALPQASSGLKLGLGSNFDVLKAPQVGAVEQR